MITTVTAAPQTPAAVAPPAQGTGGTGAAAPPAAEIVDRGLNMPGSPVPGIPPTSLLLNDGTANGSVTIRRSGNSLTVSMGNASPPAASSAAAPQSQSIAVLMVDASGSHVVAGYRVSALPGAVELTQEAPAQTGYPADPTGSGAASAPFTLTDNYGRSLPFRVFSLPGSLSIAAGSAEAAEWLRTAGQELTIGAGMIVAQDKLQVDMQTLQAVHLRTTL